jgi:hypothetical protein
MVRVLVLIAVTGFFVSLVTLSVAVAVGGPAMFEDAMWRGGWGPRWAHHGDWNGMGWDDRWDRRRGGGGAQTTRELTWSGGDSLDIDLPADVQFTQGPTATVTVSGPAREVEDVEIDGGHLSWRGGHHMHFGDLNVVMTAPSVTRFGINGSGKLTVADYKQDKLDLRISGNGDANVTGETGALTLTVSGSGDADLGGLKAKSAEVDISGSGDAKVAPSDSARIDVSGSGDVTLLTHPAQLSTHISGSGDLHQEAAPTTPQPPAQPAAPAPPAKKKGKGA